VLATPSFSTAKASSGAAEAALRNLHQVDTDHDSSPEIITAFGELILDPD